MSSTSYKCVITVKLLGTHSYTKVNGFVHQNGIGLNTNVLDSENKTQALCNSGIKCCEIPINFYNTKLAGM